MRQAIFQTWVDEIAHHVPIDYQATQQVNEIFDVRIRGIVLVSNDLESFGDGNRLLRGLHYANIRA